MPEVSRTANTFGVCTLTGQCVEQQSSRPLWPEGLQLLEETSAVVVDS